MALEAIANAKTPIARILAADDEDMCRKPLAMLLRKAGYHVDEAANIEGVYSLVKESSYDLFVLDYRFGEHTSIELIKNLRQHPSGCNTPILLITGERPQQILVEALDSGANDHIQKPFDNAVLQARVRALLRVQSQQQLIEHQRDQAEQARTELIRLNAELQSTQSQLIESNAELLEAKNAAEAGNHAKDSFLAKMSHEIRTPMNGVLGMLQLLATTPLNEQQNRWLEVAASSARALLRIIDDVLDISKIDAGTLTLKQNCFDLRTTLASVQQLFQPQAEVKGVQLELAFDSPVPPFLLGDATRIRQLLTNLLSNAIKFTDRGFIRIGVSVVQVEPDLVRLEMRVQDTGIGIKPEDQSRLFDEFFQVEDGTDRRFGGTGLGLSICRRLVELMGGEIHLESHLGFGSCFRINVPLRIPTLSEQEQPCGEEFAVLPQAIQQAPESAPLVQSRSESPLLRQPLFATSHLVLVVEDNPVNQEVCVGLLDKLGHRSHVAADGAQAIRAVRENSYDLVLMDCGLPGMDGYQTTRVLRQSESEHAHIPIVALTAHAMNGDREKCLAAGMDGYLAKPICMEKLQQTIRLFAEPQPLAQTAVEAPIPMRQIATDTIVDEAGALQLVAGDRKLLQRVQAAFTQSSAELIEQLNAAAQNADCDALAASAHALKGAAASIVAEPLRVLAERVEHAARKTDIEDANQALRELRPVLTRVLQHLRDTHAAVAE